jgi:hypothetical protein
LASPKRTPEETRRLARDKRLRAQYNISADEFDLIWKSQGGMCPICEESLTARGTPKILNVDHDHADGLTRGILCGYCNRRVVGNLTFAKVKRIYEYFLNPPATKALGAPRYGKIGRVTNKRKKRVVKKKR